jgi:cytosine/creatinine deaminase
VLHMGLHVCQMMGYEEIDQSLALISSHSARTLQLVDYGIEVGKRGSLIILPADSGFDALRRQVPVRYSIRDGQIIARCRPAEHEIELGYPEFVDFRQS